MGLELKLSPGKEFLLAAGTYCLGSLADYLSTSFGLSTNQINEIHPLIKEYIPYYAPYIAVMIPKALLSISILCSCKGIDLAYQEAQTKVSAEHILYPASILTAVTGASWFLFT